MPALSPGSATAVSAPGAAAPGVSGSDASNLPSRRVQPDSGPLHLPIDRQAAKLMASSSGAPLPPPAAAAATHQLQPSGGAGGKHKKVRAR